MINLSGHYQEHPGVCYKIGHIVELVASLPMSCHEDERNLIYGIFRENYSKDATERLPATLPGTQIDQEHLDSQKADPALSVTVSKASHR